MDIATADTTDRVRIIAKDGRIGDRREDYTRLTLSADAVALVMEWVPFVTADAIPALIRKAHKGVLLPRITTDRAEAIITANRNQRCEAVKIALAHHRNPRSWGF